MSVPAKPGVSYTIRFVGTKRDFKAGVEAEVLFRGDERAQVGERRLPIYSETIGVVFKSVSGKPGERVEASYVLQDDDLYVRAVVESSEAVTGYAKRSPQHPQHPQAWTQPLRRKFSP